MDTTATAMPPETASEAALRRADCATRYDPSSGRGHVESIFWKANSPAGDRALWVKFTVWAPPRESASPAIDSPTSSLFAGAKSIAEVWAIVFDHRSGRHVAGKNVYPIDEAVLARDRLGFRVGSSLVEEGRSRGEVRLADSRTLRWDVQFAPGAAPLRLLPSEALYRSKVFPRSKALSPYPDTRFDGEIAVGDERVSIAAWPGMLGHNWGREHAELYAWGHVNAFEGAPGTVFEGASARVRVGPVLLPFLTLLYLRHQGREYDFRGVRFWWNRSVAVDLYRWRFAARSREAHLDGELVAEPQDLVGLLYRQPNGTPGYCLNSKVARATLRLRDARGTEIATLVTKDKAALELLVRDPGHGVRISC